MHYLGGKSRLAKKFAPILNEAIARSDRGRFIEPFVGGFNIVPVVPPVPTLCNDLHRGLITMYQALQRGWQPPETLTEAQWERLKAVRDWTDPLTAFAAFGVSFQGIEFTRYARDKQGTNYAARARRTLLRKAEYMGPNVTFRHGDYHGLAISRGDVVYADPPYLWVTGYSTGPFDHERFYAWCEDAAARGARVFVSEFTIPERPGWKSVWSLDRPLMKSERRVVDHLIEVTNP